MHSRFALSSNAGYYGGEWNFSLMIPIGDSEKLKSFPWVNVALIVLNVGIFIYVYFFLRQVEPIMLNYGFVPERFLKAGWNPIHCWAKYIPLVTANFLHASILHVLGNMIFLCIFGDNVEDRLGHTGYLVFYLTCGIIALLVHTYAFQHSTRIVIGASGAIAGTLGAFYILIPKAKIRSFFIFFISEIPAVYYLFIWFLFNLLRGFLHLEGKYTEPVAWWSHVGGFIAGTLLVNLFLFGTPKVKAKTKAKD